jgi:hypothetical protein
MKKFLVLAGIVCALALTVNAQDAGKKKHELTDEQKAFMKEMVTKYDTNKDGKLDKEERAKMSAEDKAKMEKLFTHGKKAPKKDEAPAAATNAPAAAQ